MKLRVAFCRILLCLLDFSLYLSYHHIVVYTSGRQFRHLNLGQASNQCFTMLWTPKTSLVEMPYKPHTMRKLSKTFVGLEQGWCSAFPQSSFPPQPSQASKHLQSYSYRASQVSENDDIQPQIGEPIQPPTLRRKPGLRDKPRGFLTSLIPWTNLFSVGLFWEFLCVCGNGDCRCV